jgi:photosystem II stability/assembly factor-like uncharacterized protein
MKKLHIIILLSLLFAVNQTKAQWTDLKAPKSNYEDYQLFAVSDNGKNLAALSGKLDMTTFKVNLIYTISHDYGANWQVYQTKQIGGGQTMFWEGDDLYVQSANATIANLMKSGDFGATFTVQNSSYNTQTPIVRSPNGKWYLENSSILNYSSDKGATWIQKGLGTGQYFIDYVIANNGNIVATVNGGAAYSTDGGDTWIYSSFPSNDLKTIYNSISKSPDGTIFIFKQTTPTSLVCKSTDNGVSWQALNLSLPANTKKLLYCGTDMIAYTVLGSTYKSTDGGMTFSALTPANPLITVTDMIVTNSTVYIFGMSGIYKYGNSTTGLTESLNDNELSVFPNPFSSHATIQTGNPLKNATFTLCNSLGKTVKQIENISGMQFTLHRDNLPTGLYFIRLTQNNQVIATKKLMITN